MSKLISRFNPKSNWLVKFLNAWLKDDKLIVTDELTEFKDGKLQRCNTSQTH